MATLVQDSTASASTASGSPYNVFASNVTVGNGVLLAINNNAGGAGDTISSVSSPIGTFVFIGRSNTNTTSLEFWYCAKATGAAQSVTVTWTTSTTWTADGQEWNSAFSSAGSANATNGTVTTAVSGSVTPSTGQLAVVAFSASKLISTAPSSPWINDSAAGGGGGIWNGDGHAGVAYQIAASGSTLTANWTVNAAASYNALGVALTFASSLPTRTKGLPAAVRRANNYFKRESGLWEPERGLIVPRAA